MQHNFKALLLDLSGVMYQGDKVIPGAIETLDEARRQGMVLRFLTNTATKNHTQILSQLSDMGFYVQSSELFTAPVAASDYLESNRYSAWSLVHAAVEDAFKTFEPAVGETPDCVLIGDAQSKLSYENLNIAFQHCMAGARLLGIGMNKYFSDGEQLKLDAGAFIKAIEWASGQTATILGKPSQMFFEGAVSSTGLPASECLMVGDDVDSDVLAAHSAGLSGCLVKTGKYRAGDETKLVPGTYQIESIASLFEEV